MSAIPSYSYSKTFAASLQDAEQFWAEAAADIHWTRTWDRVLDDSELSPVLSMVSGAELNTCYNTLDLHVDEDNGSRDPMTLRRHRPGRLFHLLELRDAVATFAEEVLAARGVSKGDRVIVYMPMVPEAVIAMLTCALGRCALGRLWWLRCQRYFTVRLDDATPRQLSRCILRNRTWPGGGIQTVAG